MLTLPLPMMRLRHRGLNVCAVMLEWMKGTRAGTEQSPKTLKALVSSSGKTYPARIWTEARNVKMLHKQLLGSAQALALFLLESRPANRAEAGPPLDSLLPRSGAEGEQENLSLYSRPFLFPPWGVRCLSHCTDPPVALTVLKPL